MDAIGSFIIRPLNDKLYNNERTVKGSKYLVDTSIDSHENTNRFATVISTPAGYIGEVMKEDVVIVHHNVFRKVNDIRGKEMYSTGLLKDDYYLADDLEVYAYKRAGVWSAISPYIFIEPILSDNKTYDTSNEQVQYGVVVMDNKELNGMSVIKGDTICFQPDSEYKFTVDGVKLYRMKTESICLKV